MKKLFFLCLLAFNSMAQYGLVTPDSTTLSGPLKINSSSMILDSRTNNAVLDIYINGINPPQSNQYYLKSQIGSLSARKQGGIMLTGIDTSVKLLSYDNYSGGKLTLYPTGILVLESDYGDQEAKFINRGFTQLGDYAPAIKMKKLTGTTSAIQSGQVSIALGVPTSKVLGVQVLVEYAEGNFIPPNYSANTGYLYDYYLKGSNHSIVVWNKSGNSSFILSKPVKVLITYEE